MKLLFPGTSLLLWVVLLSSIGSAQSIECSVEINGALRGGPGNIQDNMFHSLAIDPTNENVVYAGTETSGIFKTTDGGVTWTRLRRGFKCGTEKTGYPQIFDIAIDPTNTQTLYASTVNGPGPADNPLFPSATAGVYKSIDGGQTWIQKVQGLTNTYTSYVLVDATNPNRLYAGLGGVRTTFALLGDRFFEGGIWVSSNGGDLWSPLTLPPGVNTNILIDIVLRGADQRTIYASGQLHGTDAGQTWSIVNPAGVRIYGFDAYLRDPNILYGHDDTPSRRVHRSTDGGDSWIMIPNRSFFGAVRLHPRDSQTLFFIGRNNILKTTDGFATTRSTYTDSGLAENLQMLDIKISQSNPNVVWACAKGYYLYKSTDGGETFTKIIAVRDLIYGSPTTQSLAAAFNSPSRLTGIALLNSGQETANVTLTAYENSGGLMTATAGRNPATVSVPARGQLSRLLTDLFGATTSGSFWVKVSSNWSGVTGFFLNLDPGLNTLDGANFVNRATTDLIFPEIQDAELSFVNPSETIAADVTVKFYDNDGIERAAAPSIRIPPNGRFTGRVSDLFPPSQLSTEGYLRATSTRDLVALGQFGSATRDGGVLGALYADSSARRLFSPQYVVGGGYKSTVTIINLEDIPTTVNAGWIDSFGALRGRPVRLNLPARGRGVIGDADIFGVTVPPSGLEGYLTINSTSTLIAGSVRFGDAADVRFQASLPLLALGAREAVYSHVAQDAIFFTGASVLNANNEPANVVISIFNPEGTQLGTGRRTIPPNGRISEVLSQIDPQLPAVSGGYFKISSDRPVVSFALFGTHNLSVLAAIPGQTVGP